MKKIVVLLWAAIAIALVLLVFESDVPMASANPPVSPPKPPGPGGGPTYKFVSNERYALVGWYGDSISGFLYVAKGGTGRNARTFLVYEVNQCTWTGEWIECFTVEAGSGYIPDGDFGPDLHLTTDTSANPDFYLWAGSGGVIDVEWKPIKTISIRHTGTLQQRMSQEYRYLQSGMWESSMASAQGSVIGHALEGDVWSETGMNHGVTIEFVRGD